MGVLLAQLLAQRAHVLDGRVDLARLAHDEVERLVRVRVRVRVRVSVSVSVSVRVKVRMTAAGATASYAA